MDNDLLQDFEDENYTLQIRCGWELKYARVPGMKSHYAGLVRQLTGLWGDGQLVMPDPHDPQRLEWRT